MKSFNKLFTLSLVTLAVSSVAHADVRINGFANFTGGIASSEDTLYGFEDSIDYANQSLFGLQVSGDVSENVTATGQIVTRGSDDFSANFEWAYLTYAATENTSVSVGRLRMPLFRYSSSLDVAYSYHWVVAPASVYDVPFNNIDGIRVDYAGYSGDWEYGLQFVVGNVNNEFTLGGQPGELTINNVALVSADLAYENWKFRGVYATSKVTFDIPALDAPFGQLGQISSDFESTLQAVDDTGVFYGASIEYDAFNWFVAAEYTGIEIEDSFYPQEENYYVTAGIRTGKWTPFITYEKSDINRDPKFVGDIAAFPAPLQVPLTQLVVGIQQSVMSENNTLSVGTRYDLSTSIALKADITKFTNDINDEEDSLVRFAVNYVF
ncbi:MAG: porin [Glaciecola sp.]|jgi:hypothetical protein